ncbi:GNAT family N-acetyltransferase [Gracilibacillus oryzae]|uniref:GNAT family N-acetyltransferase n=1 Tax=Gracilibacillus oryzae TaxID=1672701 RepID=A0A7C8KQ94_9BACI|nr:GNAT family protein [Gracilibacillus oryzae]KAB8135772.1 GNAT family N-acetyltransferase [Gracilibacillus oryzae]
MNHHLTTKRLQLHKISIADAPKLFRIWSDPEVTRYMNITRFNSEKEAEDMIAFLNELAKQEKAIRYSIFLKESDELIGSCGFNSFDKENSITEIGYDIAKEHWGNGYAPEAITSLLETAFNVLEINRVEAKVEPENLHSIKVLEKLNFTYEGRLRHAEKSKGRFVDLNVYSRLKSD